MSLLPDPARMTPLPRPGHLSLVGAGPGAADLMTYRAVRHLQQADIVLYDRLISAEVLALIPQAIARLDVGKDCGNHRWTQSDIDARIRAELPDSLRPPRTTCGSRVSQSPLHPPDGGFAWGPTKQTPRQDRTPILRRLRGDCQGSDCLTPRRIRLAWKAWELAARPQPSRPDASEWPWRSTAAPVQAWRTPQRRSRADQVRRHHISRRRRVR